MDGGKNAAWGAEKPLKSSGPFAPCALPSGPSPGAVQRPRSPAAALPCGDGPPAAPAAAAARPGVSAARPRRCLTAGVAAAAAARGRPTPAPPPPPERGVGGGMRGDPGGGARRWRGARERRDARGAGNGGLHRGARGRGGCVGCTEPVGSRTEAGGLPRIRSLASFPSRPPDCRELESAKGSGFCRAEREGVGWGLHVFWEDARGWGEGLHGDGRCVHGAGGWQGASKGWGL